MQNVVIQINVMNKRPHTAPEAAAAAAAAAVTMIRNVEMAIQYL